MQHPFRSLTLFFSFMLFLPCIAQDTLSVTEYGKEQHIGEAGVKARRKPSAKLWTTAENSELISTAGLRTAACCNLGESFVNSVSVDVNYSDATTGAQQIRLLGLSGTYVQMLTENIPNLRNVASPYGMDYIPGPWMNSIQVSKGITSVKHGYEAITGQINVEHNKPDLPDPDRLHIELYGDIEATVEASADATFILPSGWGTTLLTHYNRDLIQHDANGDSFVDMPQKEQYTLMNRWHYQGPHYKFQAAAKFLSEERRGGQTTEHHSHTLVTPYHIDINTRRVEAFVKNAYFMQDAAASNIALIISGSYHDQDADFGHPAQRLTTYDVAQTNLYASLMYETGWKNDRHTLSAGLSTNYDGLRRTHHSSTTVTSPWHTSSHELVAGLYAQYALNINKKWLLQPGLRYDHSSLWGSFITPRLHLKYTPSSRANLRLSVGKGYRTAFVMDENTHLLSSSRKIIWDEHTGDSAPFEPALRESAWNMGLSGQFKLPVGQKLLNVTAEYYYTDFQKQAVLDLDRDAHALHIYPLHGRSFSQVVQLELSYPLMEGLTATAAFRWNDNRSTFVTAENTTRLRTLPLTSRHKTLLSLQYLTPLEHWQFNATLCLNGPGRLPDPDSTAPLWNTRYKAFAQLSAQVTRNFRHWSLYLGGENLTNYTQKHPIISADDPWSDTFDPHIVWAPVDGWMLYLGARFIL